MYVKQAANALEILEYFAHRQRPATIAELADGMQWPRSSTFNLVGTLVEKGFLYEPQSRNGYYPSPRWLRLAEEVSRVEPLPEELIALADRLNAATNETTIIGAFAGTKALFLHVVESRYGIRYFANVGQQVPIHASSIGRALLSQLSPAERRSLYRKIEFESFTEHTPVNAEAVEAHLAAAAKRGYHQSFSEYEADLAGVALPLPVEGRRLSVVVVGPVSRCVGHRREIAALMKRHVAALQAAALNEPAEKISA